MADMNVQNNNSSMYSQYPVNTQLPAQKQVKTLVEIVTPILISQMEAEGNNFTLSKVRGKEILVRQKGKSVHFYQDTGIFLGKGKSKTVTEYKNPKGKTYAFGEMDQTNKTAVARLKMNPKFWQLSRRNLRTLLTENSWPKFKRKVLLY